jgi:sugar phosphate isomerase/epimerase
MLERATRRAACASVLDESVPRPFSRRRQQDIHAMPQRLSFQLYSARNFPLTETIALLANIGYREVEGFGGVYGDPGALRALLDAHGLTMPSGHFGPDMLENERTRVLDIARTLGMRHLYAPYLPAEERPKTAAGWRRFGKRLAALGDWARGEGYGFGWHNHDFEFVKLASGERPIDLIFAAAPLLDWEIDVAWVARAGLNPVPWIRKHAGRITSAHVKDVAPRGANAREDGWADLGKGTLDWKACFAALRKTRVLHYALEHDNPGDLERFAKRSFAYATGI